MIRTTRISAKLKVPAGTPVEVAPAKFKSCADKVSPSVRVTASRSVMLEKAKVSLEPATVP